MSKLISVRKPRLRIGPTGVRVTRPSARIGGKAGLNISKRGVSASVRTPVGTISTRKVGGGGSRRTKKAGAAGCVLPALLLLTVLVAAIVVAIVALL